MCIRDSIYATVGIGTNLFLAKIALDILAKHAPDFIGYLDESLFKEKIWYHQPLTDICLLYTSYGYGAMFIAMVLENANIPIPSEIVLGFAGYLIAQGIFDLHTTMVVGILAGIVGSILSYWMGEHGGRPLLLKYGKYIFFNEHKFELAEKLFNKYGGAAVFFGRLLPGVRTFISFPAGMARYPMWHFVIWTCLLYTSRCV